MKGQLASLNCDIVDAGIVLQMRREQLSQVRDDDDETAMREGVEDQPRLDGGIKSRKVEEQLSGEHNATSFLSNEHTVPSLLPEDEENKNSKDVSVESEPFIRNEVLSYKYSIMITWFYIEECIFHCIYSIYLCLLYLFY